MCKDMSFCECPWAQSGVLNVQAEAKTVDQACASSCQEACRSSISEFTEARQKFSGFVSQPQERDKITRACTRRCVYECKKPADGYVFEVNTRR